MGVMEKQVVLAGELDPHFLRIWLFPLQTTTMTPFSERQKASAHENSEGVVAVSW